MKMTIRGTFLNENVMKAASIISVLCGLAALVIYGISGRLTLLILFEKLTKITTTLVLYRAFSRFHWDAVRGMMGGVLFCLLYQEGYLVLGSLWGGTVDFDAYLIMGVPGSLYLAAESMSFLTTMIITVNHFIIDYGHIGNLRNVMLNQITILFKILLYLLLMIVNRFLDLPAAQLAAKGISYIADLGIVVIMICIESQLDDFKTIRSELLRDKHRKGAAK